jgi:class 3 adenylate cyclase
VAELPDGTVTLLFSDMEGSTALVKRLGSDWPGLVARHRELLRVAVEAEGGVVVDCQGDAMFAAFRSARAGVRAAVRAQEHMDRERWPQNARVRLRMGLHTGEPDRTEDGYAGIDVVHAARLCAAGHGGQVLLTEAARLVSGADTRSLGPVALPDMDGPEPVNQLVGPTLAEEFPPLRSGVSSPLEGMEHADGGFDARIERAEAAFEERLNDQIAGLVERALEAPFRKRTKE